MGKFDSRSDEGIFLGYFSTSKAYQVYNKRIMKVIETVNVVVNESSDSSSEKGIEELSKEILPPEPREVQDITEQEPTSPSTPNTPSVEPKKVEEALQDESWAEAVHDELLQFQRNDVWTLVPRPEGAIEFNLRGTLQAPSDVASFNGKDGWVVFEHIDGLTVSGGGVFDGKGQQAWQKNECSKEKSCNVLPINIRFDYVTNSKVQDITSKDSKFFHINLLECKKLQFQHVTITAPADSPNTDGIHVGRSSQTTITNANIGTCDDCISVGDGAQDITVNQVTCGPGHGISIGSLGRYENEEPVSEIRVTSATLSNTKNAMLEIPSNLSVSEA
nr:exopolygalacturonase-like [Quercus suber]